MRDRAPRRLEAGRSFTHPLLAEARAGRYLARVNGLTKQEITVLTLIAALLLTGWFVKYYRATHLTIAVTPSAHH